MATPKTMKAIIFTGSPAATYAQPSSVSSLVLDPSQLIPVPTPKQHLIRIHATAITPYELSWPISPYPHLEPRIPCHDTAGTIVSPAAGSPFQPGDRVFSLLPFTNQGAMAEYAVAEPEFLAKLPEGLEFVEAASIPRAALTSWQALKIRGDGFVKRGMKVLVTGATGAVGRMGVQISRDLVGEVGRVIAVGGVGSASLKDLGADVVVNYRDQSTWENMVRLEGQVDVVFDCIGGEALEKSFPLVRDGGRVVTIASPPPNWETLMGWKEAEARGMKKEFFIVEESGEQLSEIARLWANGDIKPSVGLIVEGLTEDGVRDGWRSGLKGGIAGSVIIRVF